MTQNAKGVEIRRGSGFKGFSPLTGIQNIADKCLQLLCHELHLA